MTRRKSPEPLTKCSINLFSSDIEAMKGFYPQVGYLVAIRALVRQHVTNVKVRAAALVDMTELDELEIEI